MRPIDLIRNRIISKPKSSAVIPLSFDGSTYATRGAGLTGAADGTGLTVLWAGTMGGADGSAQWFSRSNDGRGGFAVRNSTNNEFRCILKSTGGVTLSDFVTSSGSGVAGTSFVWVYSLDSSNVAGTRKSYLNGVSDLSASVTVNGTLDFTDTNIGLGAQANGNNKTTVDCIYVVWPVYIDLSVLANQEKFYKNNRLRDIGATGLGPSLGAPIMFFRGPHTTGSTVTNYGTGGDFTVQAGALTDGTPIQTVL